MVSSAVLLLIVFALWCPYGAGSVPEWRVQIVDDQSRPVVGAQVSEEWLNPIEDGMVSLDSRDTDSNGMVVFPRRVLQNRLALGFPKIKPSSHVFVCWMEQYGQAFWDENGRRLAAQLVLSKGACPYS
jgi:hypothetical protein